MAYPTRVSIPHQRALSQEMICVAKAPIAPLSAGEYLRATRSALSMSQKHLARRSGVPQANIARIERGLVDPQIGTLRRLYDAMFCDMLVIPRSRGYLRGILAARRAERKSWQTLWGDD